MAFADILILPMFRDHTYAKCFDIAFETHSSTRRTNTFEVHGGGGGRGGGSGRGRGRRAPRSSSLNRNMHYEGGGGGGGGRGQQPHAAPMGNGHGYDDEGKKRRVLELNGGEVALHNHSYAVSKQRTPCEPWPACPFQAN